MKHCLVNQSVQGCSRVNRLLYACGTFSMNESHWCNALTAVWWVHYSHTKQVLTCMLHYEYQPHDTPGGNLLQHWYGYIHQLVHTACPKCIVTVNKLSLLYMCIHKCSSTTPSATTTTVSPYVLFTTRFSIYRMNIDGSEKQVIVREPSGGINAVNYHYRYG